MYIRYLESDLGIIYGPRNLKIVPVAKVHRLQRAAEGCICAETFRGQNNVPVVQVYWSSRFDCTYIGYVPEVTRGG